MYRDINGKTGMKGLQGASGKTYGNMKLYSAEEKAAIFADGITEVVPTAKPVSTPAEELAKAKERKLRYIEGAYVYMINSDVTYNGAPFQADGRSREAIHAKATDLLRGWVPPAEYFWLDSNNTQHPADADFINGLATAVVAAGDAHFITKQTLKAQANAASTVEEIEGVRDEVTGEVTGGIYWAEYDALINPVVEDV